jgi:hypothetical protein
MQDLSGERDPQVALIVAEEDTWQGPMYGKCGLKGHTTDLCRAPSKEWIGSENERMGISSNPRLPNPEIKGLFTIRR